MGTCRLAVLLSGSGSTLQNILDVIDRGELDARVTVVVSSRPGVRGLERAADRGIANHVVPRKDYDSPRAFSGAINALLREHDIDLICLAGFMSLYLLDPAVCPHAMNIHPALIPAFCGKGYYGEHVHQAVLDYGVKVSGATVHFVNDAYDNGPIIVQGTCPVEEDDNIHTLAARVKTVEDEIYPEAIRRFAAGRLVVEGRRVRTLPTLDQLT